MSSYIQSIQPEISTSSIQSHLLPNTWTCTTWLHWHAHSSRWPAARLATSLLRSTHSFKFSIQINTWTTVECHVQNSHHKHQSEMATRTGSFCSLLRLSALWSPLNNSTAVGTALFFVLLKERFEDRVLWGQYIDIIAYLIQLRLPHVSFTCQKTPIIIPINVNSKQRYS